MYNAVLEMNEVYREQEERGGRVGRERVREGKREIVR